MFNQNGLSLNQAPPISVVFRFFFLGSIFGIFAGISLFFYQTDIFNPSSIAALTFTHLLTLGVMLSFMFAALFQMLPVIAGITLTYPSRRANLLLYPFSLGVVSLLLAFNLQIPWLYIIAGLLLGFSIMITIIPMGLKLQNLQSHSSSSKGMLFALFALGLVVFLALYLLTTLSGFGNSTLYTSIKSAHYSFGLFGWVALLIISISFQVIEMFYVTPPYPDFIRRTLPLSLFTLLLASSFIGLVIPELWIVSHSILALILISYALLTLKRLAQKKRPLSDATVWFWRLGLSNLVLSMISMLTGEFSGITIAKHLSYIFFASFPLSIVFAMFYKIVPFLTWFHLSSQGYFTAPMMHEVIHPKTAKKHLYIHLTTIITFILSLFISPFIFIAGLLTILSFGWMAYQIIHAWKLYIHTQKTGEKFEMVNM